MVVSTVCLRGEKRRELERSDRSSERDVLCVEEIGSSIWREPAPAIDLFGSSANRMPHERVVIQGDWRLSRTFCAAALHQRTVAQVELVRQLLANVAVHPPQVVARWRGARLRKLKPRPVLPVPDSMGGALQTDAPKQDVEEPSV